MLLNISNHPWKKWSDKQKETAIELFGGVEDLIFPDIDPGLSLEDVQVTASDYLSYILKIKEVNKDDEKGFSVLISGEYTLVYRLLRLLEENEIKSYCATSKRDVSYNADGSKNINFAFVTFRPYY